MRLAIKLGVWLLVIFSPTIAMVFAQQFGLMPADPFFGLSTVIGLVQCVFLLLAIAVLCRAYFEHPERYALPSNALRSIDFLLIALVVSILLISWWKRFVA